MRVDVKDGERPVRLAMGAHERIGHRVIATQREHPGTSGDQTLRVAFDRRAGVVAGWQRDVAAIDERSTVFRSGPVSVDQLAEGLASAARMCAGPSAAPRRNDDFSSQGTPRRETALGMGAIVKVSGFLGSLVSRFCSGVSRLRGSEVRFRGSKVPGIQGFKVPGFGVSRTPRNPEPRTPEPEPPNPVTAKPPNSSGGPDPQTSRFGIERQDRVAQQRRCSQAAGQLGVDAPGGASATRARACRALRRAPRARARARGRGRGRGARGGLRAPRWPRGGRRRECGSAQRCAARRPRRAGSRGGGGA